MNWLMAAVLMSLAVLVHLTTAMVIVPAALLAYLVAWEGQWGLGRASRHVAVWLIPAVVLAVNAFWWWPGIWLSATKGPSDFAFNHPEGVIHRLARIVGGPEKEIQTILLALGLPGIYWMLSRQRVFGARAAGILRRRVRLGLSGRRLAIARFLAAGSPYVCPVLGAGGRERPRAR